MTFKQIREKLKATQKKLDVTNLALIQERDFYSSMVAINEFNEKRIKDLKAELAKQYDAKMHIIKNAKKCKEERDLYYKNWIKEIDKKDVKYALNPFFYLFFFALIIEFIFTFLYFKS